MKPMTYKGYAAQIEYSDEDACFVGRIAGIQHIVTFHAENVDELRKTFQEAVNYYLDTCQKRGEEPQKPYSGRVMLRIPPKLHASLVIRAQIAGKSLNNLITETLARMDSF
jgi:predicted HicB family RNase H-like nuclease